MTFPAAQKNREEGLAKLRAFALEAFTGKAEEAVRGLGLERYLDLARGLNPELYGYEQQIKDLGCGYSEEERLRVYVESLLSEIRKAGWIMQWSQDGADGHGWYVDRPGATARAVRESGALELAWRLKRILEQDC